MNDDIIAQARSICKVLGVNSFDEAIEVLDSQHEANDEASIISPVTGFVSSERGLNRPFSHINGDGCE